MADTASVNFILRLWIRLWEAHLELPGRHLSPSNPNGCSESPELSRLTEVTCPNVDQSLCRKPMKGSDWLYLCHMVTLQCEAQRGKIFVVQGK